MTLIRFNEEFAAMIRAGLAKRAKVIKEAATRLDGGL
jgi:hypothetical protein